MDHSDPLERATQSRPRGETWTEEQFREAREADLAERTAAISPVVIATLTCLLLAALLTSGKIVEIAERQEFGPTRDRQLAFAESLDRAANFLSLNRPYDAIRSIRGAGEDVGERVDNIEDVAASTTTTTAPPTTSSVATAEGTSSTSSSTTTTPQVLRVVTEARPLKVLVAGDSQAEYLGQAITTESPGWELDVTIDDRISTSLARPDYFNWPAHLAALLDEDPPEVVILFMGANDHQDMADAAGERLVEGSAGWQAEWTHRLEVTLDLLVDPERQILWVTQPPMRDGGLDEGVRLINSLAAQVIAERDLVTEVDIWDLFGGDGGYQNRLVGDGETIDARVDDGVHLTRSAASWVADLVFDQMADTWAFADQSGP